MISACDRDWIGAECSLVEFKLVMILTNSGVR